MPAGGDPVPAYGDGDQVVQVESSDGGPPAGGASDDEGTILAPTKVSLPLLAARVEQPNPATSQQVTTVGLVALKQVTGMARQPEVFFIVHSTFRPWNDVINFKHPGHILLVCLAVAAAVSRLGAYSGAEGVGDCSGSHDSNGPRKPRLTASANASDWRIQSWL